jgi:hypothetical protein
VIQETKYRLGVRIGYQGFVSFTSKTKLIEHYEDTLGATHVGGHRMVIFPTEALQLIRKYFPI